MLYTLTIHNDTTTTIVVDPDVAGIYSNNGPACQGFVSGLNCDGYAHHTIHVAGPEYIGSELYCDSHIAEGILNLLEPEPNCC